MFTVDEPTAKAIRYAYEDGGVELRRLPLLADNSHARLRVRAIAGWKPVPGDVSLWAVASAVTGIASLPAGVLPGVAEAPAFPASQKATGLLIPRKRASLLDYVFHSAAKFSNVIGVSRPHRAYPRSVQ